MSSYFFDQISNSQPLKNKQKQADFSFFFHLQSFMEIQYDKKRDLFQNYIYHIIILIEYNDT